MALLMVRNIIKSRVIILFTIVLRAVTSYTTEPTPSNTFTMLCSIIVLIIFKVLSNIVIAVKKLIIIKLTIY